MEEEVSRISRRRLLKRLGLGTAVATLTPIVSSLGTEALARTCPPCEGTDCFWTCGGTLQQCGSNCGIGDGYCSQDIDGNCFCWADSFCSELTSCTSNSDCPPGYACIPGTCCGFNACIPGCGLGPRSRRRHGKLATGRVR
jgi:hypothetical protein